MAYGVGATVWVMRELLGLPDKFHALDLMVIELPWVTWQ